MECLGLRWHEESWISSDLAQRRVSQTILYNTIDEAEGHRMVLHLRVIELVKFEGRANHDRNRVVAPVERTRSLECDPLIQLGGRVQVAADEDELHEDLLQLLRVCVDDLVLLKGFQRSKRASRVIAPVIAQLACDSMRVLLLAHGCMTLNEVDFIGVDNAAILTTDAKVVRDEHNRSLVLRCHPRLPWAAEHGPPSPTLPPARVVLVLVRSMIVLSSFHLETMKI